MHTDSTLKAARLDGYSEGLRVACDVLVRSHVSHAGSELLDAHEALLQLRHLSIASAEGLPERPEAESSKWLRMWSRALDGAVEARRANEALLAQLGELVACRDLEDRLRSASLREDAVAIAELTKLLDGRADLAWARARETAGSVAPAERLLFGSGARLSYRIESDRGDCYEVEQRISARQYEVMLLALNQEILSGKPQAKAA